MGHGILAAVTATLVGVIAVEARGEAAESLSLRDIIDATETVVGASGAVRVVGTRPNQDDFSEVLISRQVRRRDLILRNGGMEVLVDRTKTNLWKEGNPRTSRTGIEIANGARDGKKLDLLPILDVGGRTTARIADVQVNPVIGASAQLMLPDWRLDADPWPIVRRTTLAGDLVGLLRRSQGLQDGGRLSLSGRRQPVGGLACRQSSVGLSAYGQGLGVSGVGLRLNGGELPSGSSGERGGAVRLRPSGGGQALGGGGLQLTSGFQLVHRTGLVLSSGRLILASLDEPLRVTFLFPRDGGEVLSGDNQIMGVGRGRFHFSQLPGHHVKLGMKGVVAGNSGQGEDGGQGDKRPIGKLATFRPAPSPMANRLESWAQEACAYLFMVVGLISGLLALAGDSGLGWRGRLAAGALACGLVGVAWGLAH